MFPIGCSVHWSVRSYLNSVSRVVEPVTGRIVANERLRRVLHGDATGHPAPHNFPRTCPWVRGGWLSSSR